MNPPYEFNLRQEADYVLGMMDLYENDGEIAGILRTKGLTNDQVAQVPAMVRQVECAKHNRSFFLCAGIWNWAICLGYHTFLYL